MARTKKTEEKEKKQGAIVVSGKRKTAIAKATITSAETEQGRVRINFKPLEHFNYFQRLTLSEPLEIAKEILGEAIKKINIDVKVSGSGTESQTEASRLAIARALVAFTKSPELKNAFLRYDRALLIADTRRKEMRKPCDSKARAARQKSYR